MDVEFGNGWDLSGREFKGEIGFWWLMLEERFGLCRDFVCDWWVWEEVVGESFS